MAHPPQDDKPSSLQLIHADPTGTRRRYRLKRRRFLQGALAIGATTALGVRAPAVIASERSIKIGSYGGYFENSFIDYIYPEFTAATGIKVESVTQPNSNDWLTTMEQATRAGAVPADLSLYAKDSMIRGHNMGELFTPYDLSRIGNASNLDAIYVYDPGTGVVGIGAMAWYTSMVANHELVDPLPTSWADFWSEAYRDKLGMAANYDARLIDIVAATFFDGAETLSTEEGIQAVIDKAGELKPNVKIWWKAENVMQNALQNEEVVAGMYYHDVTGLMAAEGFPVVSLFPKESNPIGYGSWCLSSASEKIDEAHEFVNFSCDPATQAMMSRNIGTAPLVAQSVTDLTDEEFAAVASAMPPIVPAYEAYLSMGTFISDAWNKMLTS